MLQGQVWSEGPLDPQGTDDENGKIVVPPVHVVTEKLIVNWQGTER